MVFEFTPEKFEEIATVLGVPFKMTGNVVRYEISDESHGRKMALEIHSSLLIDGNRMNLISVYSAQTFMQLHNCTGFIASELLEQVTFFAKNGNQTTGLIIEKGAGCSLYANVDESLLRGDFTKLPTELMMCSVALSLGDNLEDGFTFSTETL